MIFGGSGKLPVMDERDSAIVRQLQVAARQTNRDLARTLGIAPSTCLERVRALQASGAITGYHAEVSLPVLNRHVQALLAVQIRPLSRPVIQGFKAYVQALPEVLSVFVLTGGDDFLVHVAVPSIDALHALLMDKISKRREIIGFRTSVIYEHARNQVVGPLV
jgi:DNA-binding Lrp family transcriptional regulator